MQVPQQRYEGTFHDGLIHRNVSLYLPAKNSFVKGAQGSYLTSEFAFLDVLVDSIHEHPEQNHSYVHVLTKPRGNSTYESVLAIEFNKTTIVGVKKLEQLAQTTTPLVHKQLQKVA
ncbi:MAG: hypothetical protein ACMXYD_04560 [Candidatus Woesearchaeota archaeon]